MQEIKITHCPLIYAGICKYGWKFPGILKASRFQTRLLLLKASSSQRFASYNLKRQKYIYRYTQNSRQNIYIHLHSKPQQSTNLPQVISQLYLKDDFYLPSILITALTILNPGNVWLEVQQRAALSFQSPICSHQQRAATTGNTTERPSDAH